MNIHENTALLDAFVGTGHFLYDYTGGKNNDSLGRTESTWPDRAGYR